MFFNTFTEEQLSLRGKMRIRAGNTMTHACRLVMPAVPVVPIRNEFNQQKRAKRENRGRIKTFALQQNSRPIVGAQCRATAPMNIFSTTRQSRRTGAHGLYYGAGGENPIPSMLPVFKSVCRRMPGALMIRFIRIVASRYCQPEV